MDFIQAFIIAVIEGLTEFLPVSSTGHMIIASSFMGIQESSFVKLFEIVIQLGAICSVLAVYWKQFFKSFDFYIKLFIAFIPAVIFGLLFKKIIHAAMESVVVVACALIIGGVILLFVDKWFLEKDAEKEPNNLESFKIGMFQVLAMIPGVSRSAATIIGGLTQGLSRAKAAEFSFFLAVPTMFAASVKDMYDFYKEGYTLQSSDISILVFGSIIAFIVAMLAIKYFIAFLTKHGFYWFGWYRIIVGFIILLCSYFNWIYTA